MADTVQQSTQGAKGQAGGKTVGTGTPTEQSMDMTQYGSVSEASERTRIAMPEARARTPEWVKNVLALRNQLENSRDFRFSGKGPWRNFPSGGAGCMANIGQVAGQKIGHDLASLCNIDPVIRFTEARYSTLNVQTRVFIEGAEVTPWLEGSVSWSYQSTGGQGTCSFTLNNNNDAFIVTPQNICAGVKNPAGWRIYRGDKGGILADTAPITWNHDESAKFIIYRNKYLRVDPENKNGKAKIDKDGIWLYPLEPLTPVFNKHDCVRVFCRLAHVTGGVTFADQDGKIMRSEELWVPAWTGFIDQHSTNDDLVSGHRTISVQCYDFRGLMARMRVRVDHNPNPGRSPEGQAEKAVVDALVGTICDLPKGTGEEIPPGKMGYLALLKRYNALGFLNDTFLALYEALAIMRRDPTKANEQKSLLGKLNKIITQVKTDVKETRVTDDAFNRLVYDVVCGLKDVYKSQTQASAHGANNYEVRMLDDGLFHVTEVKKSSEGILGDGKVRTALVQAVSRGGEIDGFCTVATQAWTGILPWKTQWDAYKSNRDSLIAKAKQAHGWAGVPASDLTISAKLLADFVQALTRWVSDSQGVNSAAFKTINDGSVTVDNLMRAFGGIKKDGTWTLATPAVYETLYEDRYLPIVAKIVEAGVNTFGGKMTNDGKNALAAAFAAVNTNGATTFNNVLVRARAAKTDLWTAAPLFLLGLGITGGGTMAQIFIAISTACNTAVDGTINTLKGLPAQLDGAVAKINVPLARVHAARAELAAILDQALKGDARAGGKFSQKVLTTILRQRRGPGNDPNKDKSSLADIITKDVSYKEENAGMFADIVRSSGQDAHPLAGLPFELAVEWLCLKNTKVTKGVRANIGAYGSGSLQAWNKTALFGMYGRPLTYQEVTAMGRGTIMEPDPNKGPFSPIQPFLHILLPRDGTGAMTIVQQHIQANTAGSQQYRYETRLALLNEICEVLDYQFYVSPVGDLVFEFPHYGAIPSDFGKVFQGAYTIAKDLQTSKIGHETGPMYSAWILQGMETDLGVDPVGSTQTANQMKKVVIVMEGVARRLGANPRYINLKVPGVGANVQTNATAGLGTPQQQLVAYAYIAIQRDIGKSESVAVDHPYRPYLLPNRPFWVVHRQRIGLTASVDVSVQVHKGEATARTELGYIRKLFRDGTYRNSAGGWRMPIDYAGINAGSVPTAVQFGAGNTKKPNAAGLAESNDLAKLWAEQNHGATTPSAGAPSKCGPAMKNAWVMAGANYDDAAAGLSSTAASLRLQRDDLWAPNPGDKQEAIDLQGTGVTSQDPPKKAKTTFTDFKSPFVAGLSVGKGARETTVSPMNNFGFIGSPGTSLYDQVTRYHPGIDIPTSAMKQQENRVLAPIPFDKIETLLSPYGRSKMVDISEQTWREYAKDPTARPFLSDGAVRSKSGTTYTWQADVSHINIYRANPKVTVRPQLDARGLWMSCYGWVTLPNDPNSGRIRCRLWYLHLDKMVYRDDNPKNGLFYGSAKMPTCEAGTKLAVAGNSGNSMSPHLHLNMYIAYNTYNGESIGTDINAFEAARKATLEYLRATLLARITKGKISSGKVSDEWKTFMKARGDVSLAEAIRYAENIVADRLKEYLVPTSMLKGNEQWVAVNPYLFFDPEQLVTPLIKSYAANTRDKEYVVDATQICGVSQSGVALQMAREERKCMADVRKMKQSKAKDEAFNRCKAIKKANAELLAMKTNSPDATSESLARLMAVKNDKPGAGAQAPR